MSDSQVQSRRGTSSTPRAAAAGDRTEPLRVCIVGAGIAGLAAAHLLSYIADFEVVVIEADEVIGGRANVTVHGEHCPRFFLVRYDHFFGLLSEIPDLTRNLSERFVPAERFARMGDGSWRRINHLYVLLASDLTWRQRLSATRRNRGSLLIAKRSLTSTNRFGAAANYTPRTALSSLVNFLRVDHGFVLPGDTEKNLIGPWVRFLTSRGVRFETGDQVDRLVRADRRVTVVQGSGRQRVFDAVVMTAFAPDAYDLLDRSGVTRRLDWRVHTHSKAYTVDLDKSEPILADPAPRVYAQDGMTVLVQPAAKRCVALLTLTSSTTDDATLSTLTDMLDLEHQPRLVRSRENLAPGEAVFIGDYVDPTSIEREIGGEVFVCGSWTSNSYPVDSAEAACRSARWAVERLLSSDLARGHGVRDASASLGRPLLPSSATDGQRREASRDREHPNATTAPRMTRHLWNGARLAARVAVALNADMSILDRSGEDWEQGRPVVFVSNHRSVFDVPAGLCVFDRLGVHPHLVIAQKYWQGSVGRALELIEALPAIRGSDATIRAAVAAVNAGRSVAFMPEGRLVGTEDAPIAEWGRGAFVVAAATGARIIPIGAWGTQTLWPQARARLAVRGRRCPVRVVVGAPISSVGYDAAALLEVSRRRVLDLEARARSGVDPSFADATGPVSQDLAIATVSAGQGRRA